MDINQHNIEIKKNLKTWEQKEVLRKVYFNFYNLIKSNIDYSLSGKIVELGSGIGNLKMVIDDCITTDIFNNPWIDKVENAYSLSFETESVSNIILFDVLHHLKYIGNVFDEFRRVLISNGRIIILEPDMSLLGKIVFGLFHHEPLGLDNLIQPYPNNLTKLQDQQYYAAQGNAYRLFLKKEHKDILSAFSILNIKRYSAISYILTGGYSKPSLYSIKLLPIIQRIDKLLDVFPALFSTRMLIVLEKKNIESQHV